jgi:alpha-L-arabinofuranosidase
VGGLNLDNRWKWKDTIGDVTRRKGTMNLWGYYSTHGLGYHELLQLCEDIGADALFVCNPGMSDQFRNAEFCKPEEVDDFIQEALDALEYELGPADSKWGAERVRNGHAEPFPLRYIEIGNEAHGETYVRNYVRFYDTIRARYPEVKIISNLHAWEDDAPAVHPPGLNVQSDIVDVHFYRSPEDFFLMEDYYDTVDRNAPKRYFGEYGSSERSEGNLMAALAEAAMLIGLERNSDHVIMSSYAPLFFNVNDIAYPVNLIGFDNHRVFGRSSYHVQKLLSLHRPDETLGTCIDPQPPAAERVLYALAGLDRTAGEVVLKVVNRSPEFQMVEIQMRGIAKIGSQAKVVTLGHEDANIENSVIEPERIVPVESVFDGAAERFCYPFPPYSLTVLRFDAVL